MKKILSMILSICLLISAMTVSAQADVYYESAADVNSDGEITLDDAIEVLKIAMKVNS